MQKSPLIFLEKNPMKESVFRSPACNSTLFFVKKRWITVKRLCISIFFQKKIQIMRKPLNNRFEFVQPLWIRTNFYDKNRWINENALQNRLEWRVRRNANETIKHPTKSNKENTTAHSPTGQKTTENTRKTTYIKLGGAGLRVAYGWAPWRRTGLWERLQCGPAGPWGPLPTPQPAQKIYYTYKYVYIYHEYVYV